MRFVPASIAVVVVLLAAGCEGEKPAAPPSAYQKPRHLGVENAAWLSTVLPSETVAYARIPNPWGLLARPRDDLLHPAQSAPGLQSQLALLRIGIRDQMQTLLPPEAGPAIDLLLNHGSAPWELAALTPADGSMVPNLLVGTTFEHRDPLLVANWLEELVGVNPQIRLFAGLDDQGNATLMAGPLPVYLHFEAATGRLWMLTGMSASEKMLVDYRAPEAGATNDQLRQLEQQFDSSGQGLALWARPQQVWPMLTPLLDPIQVSSVELAGIHQASYLWAGTANRGGHSELRLELGMGGEDGFRVFVPRIDQQTTLITAGEPSFAMRAALPSAAKIQEIVDQVLAVTADGRLVREQIAKARTQFEQLAGFAFDDFFDAFGPDLLLVSDDAGYWTALRIRDRSAFEGLKQGLAEATQTQAQSRTLGGLTVHFWHLPGMMDALSELATEEGQNINAELAIYSRIKSHFYWVEEGDYLILANVPQILIDRAASDQQLQLDQWLSRGHGLDWRHAIAAGVNNTGQSARDIYHGYLAVLLILADLVEVEIDLLAVPTAGKLGLPTRGRYAFQIDSGPERFSMSLQYGHTPLDALVGGNALTATAVVGILAAIAIPSYNDYTLRARVGESINGAAIFKLAISEEVLSTGAYPDRQRVAEILAEGPPGNAASFDIEAGSGVIRITFADAQMQGLVLQLIPSTDGETRVDWRCQVSAGPGKYAPSACR